MADRMPPILVRWNGQNFAPANRAVLERCAQYFAEGEIYRVDFQEDHSTDKSRRHYFACIREAWKNLPEGEADRYPTPEHLRAKTLITAGYHDEFDIVLDTADQAREVGIAMRRLDSYAVIKISGTVVKLYQAKSQSKRAMNAAMFQQSKTAVLNILADLIGTTSAQLAANAQDDDEQQQPNPMPDPERQPQPPARRPARNSPDQTPTAGPNPANAPPPTSPGGSTPSTAAPYTTNGAVDRPEQTEKLGGGEPLPKTYNECLIYLKAWLSYVKSADRITARINREKAELWPTLNPPLTLGQQNYFMSLAADAINKL